MKTNQHKKANICFGCKNAVPDDCGHGCEWSRKFEPVPGWTATPTLLRSGGCEPTESWHIEACPKFDPDDERVSFQQEKVVTNGEYIRGMSSRELANFCRCSVYDAGRIRNMTDEEMAEIIRENRPMRTWPKAVINIFMSDKTITGTNSWVKWLQMPCGEA